MNRGTKQKLITLPKECNIQVGDYVRIEKIKDEK